MTLEQLANIGEALGGVAVLVSLIYLIIELRRSTRTARSSNAWNSTVALMAEWQVEDEAESQRGLDGEVGVLPLPAPPSDARGLPRGDGLR